MARGNPNMVKGGPSVNPSGRAPGRTRKLREYIASQTNNGLDAVDGLLRLARDPKTSARETKEAWIHLLDRLVGKPETSASISMLLTEQSVGRTILQMAPENRLAYLDQIRAEKVLGPAIDDMEDE